MKPFTVPLLVVALLLITETISVNWPDASMPQGLNYQSCPSGWFDYTEQRVCLRFTPTEMTLKEAEQFCSLNGGKLVSVWLILNSKGVFSAAKSFNHRLTNVWVSVSREQFERIAGVIKKSFNLDNRMCLNVMKETDSALACVELRYQDDESGCWAYVDCNKRLLGVCSYRKPNEKNARRLYAIKV